MPWTRADGSGRTWPGSQGGSALRTHPDRSPTTTDQRVAAVRLTAKLTAYRPYEGAKPRSHADFLETLTSTDAPWDTAANGRLRSFETVETGPAGLAGSIPVRLR